MLEVYCDGGARGNPGPAAYGFVVKDKGQIIKEGAGFMGIATNNIAEYTAIVEALKWLATNFNNQNLMFFVDSQLAASQLNGIFKVKNAKIRELLFKIRELENQFRQVFYKHIPREQNKEADRLVNEVLDKQVSAL
ncbi:hypothetical protein A3A49_00960 [Candidatus Curtissbacteria bacterium RIFCSPLOWO2_01_FULL_38_11b]|uniref:RNase H type-1 domain-containing protein n=1 Tax=Candidatus Curtissbacteria bacterium RIFCSPLOWO2_01_FULL_38_11b TaxID=1797725 RepID=A0A1F5GZA3_9BACT|nr:MAG: hypothetical protein A3A49_00960 [Candidatus Curtissbacteria bacterium RIFCSPLOWO2_01_FULL_38_11b]